MKTEKLIKIVKITREAIEYKLLNFKKEISATGVAFGNIVYHVDESKSRVVKGVKLLQKLVRTNVTLGADYESRINRDLVKQGEEANFTAQSMSGQEYLNEEGILSTDIKTRTKTYVRATVENKTTPTTVYFHNNQRISKAKAIELNLFMPSAFSEEKTSGRGNMSADKDFDTIGLNLNNVISLTLNKVKYVIED